MAIEVKELCFSRGDRPILSHVSLTVPDSGAVCLYGPSGCGKSTFLRLLCGLETPQGGEISGVGRCSVVFQDNALLPWCTVEENVALPLASPEPEKVRSLLEVTGLTGAAKAYPAALSGGMARRVAIARALAYDGDTLLLDEPFSGLDEALWGQICAHIRSQFRDRPILLITHRLEEAEALSARRIAFGEWEK